MTPESSKSLPDDADTLAHPRARSDRITDDEDIIEISWYLRALQRRWKLAAAGALIGGTLAFGFASLQPLRYEAITTLMVVPPTPAVSAAINPATFRAIAENGTLAAQVIQELRLKDLTAQAFLEQAVRVEEVRGTNIVKVKVILGDPNVAAEASRLLVQKAIELTNQVNQVGGSSIEEQLQKHLIDAQERLQSAEKKLLAYKQGAQVELIKGDADAQLRERGGLLELIVNIEAERAGLAAAEQQIARQQRLLSVPNSAGSDEGLRQPDSRRDPKGEANAQMSNPYLNPLYQSLDLQIASSRTRLAALEEQRDELVNVKKIGGTELSLLNELYRRQIEQGRLQAAFDLETRIYADLAIRYEQTRTQPVGSTAKLQVIDDAIPPGSPIPRRRRQYGVFGSATGVVLAVALALLWEKRGHRL